MVRLRTFPRVTTNCGTRELQTPATCASAGPATESPSNIKIIYSDICGAAPTWRRSASTLDGPYRIGQAPSEPDRLSPAFEDLVHVTSSKPC